MKESLSNNIDKDLHHVQDADISHVKENETTKSIKASYL